MTLPDDLMARAHSLAEERFVAGSGPGGQNANKVATEVQLRVNAYKLRLSPFAFRRLQEVAGSRLTDSGDILIVAREYRTQEANRAEAREKLEQTETQNTEHASLRSSHTTRRCQNMSEKDG